MLEVRCQEMKPTRQGQHCLDAIVSAYSGDTHSAVTASGGAKFLCSLFAKMFGALAQSQCPGKAIMAIHPDMASQGGTRIGWAG